MTSEHQRANILKEQLALELFIRLCTAISNNKTTANDQADERECNCNCD